MVLQSRGFVPSWVARVGGVLFLTLLLLFAPGCGGGGGSDSSGVSNGTIAGNVFGIVGGASGRVPLSGVFVQATRVSGGVSLQRSAYSDSSGRYSLFNVPTGSWDLVFQLQGFTGGATSSSPVRAFVGSGSLASVTDIVLTQSTAAGSGNVTLYVVDGATGAAVSGATVTVGGFPASSTSYSGRYDFQVPVSVSGTPLAINVYHPGYGSVVPVPSTVSPIVGTQVALTVSLQPSQSFVTGNLQVQSFQSLYSSAGALGQISITSPQIATSFLDPLVDSQTGLFSVRVPSSSTGGSQYFDLVFTSPYFQQTQVTGILAPSGGGSASLSSPVVLQPLQATLVGNVVNSLGVTVTGYPNQVVIAETGQSATIVNGSYSIGGVPTGIPLTLRATTLVPPNAAQFGSLTVTPLAGTFAVSPIYTF